MLSKTKILATGGTASSTAINPKELSRYTPSKNSNDLLVNLKQQYNDIVSKYDIQAKDILHIDSKDLTWENIAHIEQEIYNLCNNEDKANIILICGTDNTESIAFALHLSKRIQDCLQLFNIKISLTGAMHSFDSPQADGTRNLKNALLAVNSTLPPAVYLTFNNQVIYAPQIKKQDTQSIRSFNIPVIKTCATINNASNLLTIQNGITKINQNYTKFNLPQQINKQQIVTINSEISINLFILEAIKNNINKIRALIINGTGNGTYQNSLQEIIDLAINNNILVTRASRCKGKVNYVQGEKLLASQGLSIEKLLILNMLFIANTTNNPSFDMALQNIYDEYKTFAN